MTWLRTCVRRPYRCVKRLIGRYPTTTIVILVGLYALGSTWRVEVVARDAADRSAQETEARLDAVEDLQAALASTQDQIIQETRDRTTESCKNTAAARETNRGTLLGLIDSLIPKNPDGTPVKLSDAAQARVDSIRNKILTDPPPLTCPQENGPIVIPVPATPGVP